MLKLLEPKDSILTIKYSPDNEVLIENPPRFTWMPESDEDIKYKLQISTRKDFLKEETLTFYNIPYNFYTLDKSLEVGNYYWRYSIDDDEYDYSKTRSFVVAEGIAVTPLVGRENRYDSVDMSHPRIWLNHEGINAFKAELHKDKNYCGFQDFYEKSVLEYAKSEFVGEPIPYPENKRVVSLWRGNYQTCQLALEYIRSLAVGGIMLENEEFILKSKRALLAISDWDTNGPTSRDYNDEGAFRVAYALAFGYDWLYNYLSEDERKKVLSSLYIRTEQVAKHVIINSRIHFSLYDSHAVRSLSSVLTPCCIAMLGEKEEARQWLDYTVEYLNVIYTPWGGADGGWAEGGMYWTTGMAFIIEALNTIKSFLKIDIYERPFFRKTGDFPLYCMPVDTYRASFGDQSSLGKYPGHKTAFNIRQFAGVTGKEDYQWYFDQVLEREKVIDNDFFNKGWWDFYFDDMVYRHDYKEVVLTQQKESSLVKWFRDVGWVAINKNLKDKDNHIFFLTKSSQYGSVSHSHGDQNAFVLFAFGEPLIIKSGYYIGFNTSMHKDWRRQTRSHNNILIDGKGQYAGMDKPLQLGAKGKVCEVSEKDNLVYIKEDATEAYKITAAELKKYTREIYFVDETYFVIVDTLETLVKTELDWLLHGLSEFELSDNKFSLKREKAQLEGKFVYCSSTIKEITQTDVFEGVDEQEIKDLDKQYHLTMKTGKANNHVIVTLLVPNKIREKNMVSCVIDDQGHDVYIYFNHVGNTFSLRIDGNSRY